MSTTRWNGHAHDNAWFTAGNWSGGVPTAAATTIFNDGRAWSISLGGTRSAGAGAIHVSADALTFSGGTLTAAAAQPAQGARSDLAIDKNGSVTFTAGTIFNSASLITVGGTGSGTLTVHGQLNAGQLILDQGAATVSGRSAHAVFATGGQFIDIGAASLRVAAGGTLDAGPHTLDAFYSSMIIGSGFGAGTLTVANAGSGMTWGIIYAGNGDDGDINVLDGGLLHAGVIHAGSNGDGHLTVSGAGSTLHAVNGVVIGDVQLQPVGSSLTITNGGTVAVENYFVDLQYGSLILDGSASLAGTIVSRIGKIEALVSKTAGSTVTLHNDIVLQSNNGAQGLYDHNTSVYTQAGGTLALAGVISGDNDAVLSAGTGHVTLANAANSYGATADDNATVEIATTGAAGAGTFTFTIGATQAPVLLIDAGAIFKNSIAGFSGHDTIDLRGFAFGAGVTDSFALNTLTLSNGATLSIAGTYTAANFSFADDHHGGTIIAFRH